MNLKEKVMSGLRWSAGLRLLGQLFTWAVTIVVIRLLTPEDYGLMALAGVFIAFLSMINELGLGAAIVQRGDLDQRDLQSIFGFVLVASLLFSCLLVVGAPLVAGFYNEPQLTTMLWILSLIFLFSGFSVLPRALLLKKLAYKKIATIELVGAIAGSVCTLTMALGGMGVWSLVGGYLSIRVVSMIGYYLFQPFLHRPTLRIKGMGAVLTYSGQLTLSRILWYLYTSAAATLIIGKVLGKEILGLYGVGVYLACLPMEKVGGIINQVAFPAFSTMQDDPQHAGKQFLRAVRVLCFFSIPTFWGMSSIAPEIIKVFLGEKWLAAVVPLQVVAFIVPLRMVRNIMMPALTGLGRADLDLKNEIVAVVLMPLAILVATRWGLLGVSMVWVLIFPAIFIVNLENTRKLLKLSFSAAYREMWRAVLAGLVMYLSLIILKNVSIVDFTPQINMLIYMAFGAAVYGSMTILMNHLVLREVIGLFKA